MVMEKVRATALPMMIATKGTTVKVGVTEKKMATVNFPSIQLLLQKKMKEIILSWTSKAPLIEAVIFVGSNGKQGVNVAVVSLCVYFLSTINFLVFNTG
jgi:hypothetical protein